MIIHLALFAPLYALRTALVWNEFVRRAAVTPTARPLVKRYFGGSGTPSLLASRVDEFAM